MICWIFTIWFNIFLVFHVVGPMPGDLGVNNNQLSLCINTNHCARSNWKTEDNAGSFGKIAAYVSEMPNVEIVEETSNYIHAEVSSSFFGFVDDLEIFADSKSDLIQARSVSRLGDSDLGVNAARLALLETLVN